MDRWTYTCVRDRLYTYWKISEDTVDNVRMTQTKSTISLFNVLSTTKLLVIPVKEHYYTVGTVIVAQWASKSRG